ncbi:MAG: oxygenase MpaB family protein [Actinomycetota bacterium]
MECAALSLLKTTVRDSTTGLFAHAVDPLADTESYPGDPGLLGPDSVSWPVIGDVSAFFAGIRALLVQAAHPEVVAGVIDHSSFRDDTLGRLSRTSSWVTATTYGAQPEVMGAVRAVTKAHGRVRGTSERGRPYNAASPELAAWVHNALTDSFLVAYQYFGGRTLTADEADRFVAEQSRIGALLKAAPLPQTAPDLQRWIVEHPDIEPTAAQRSAVEFIRNPPLPAGVLLGYRPLFAAAVATLPPSLQRQLDLSPAPGAIAAGRVAASFLRWSLGTSPSWHRAEGRALASAAPAGSASHEASTGGGAARDAAVSAA